MKLSFSPLYVALALPLILSACGKGLHMTIPASQTNAVTENATSARMVTPQIIKARDGSSIRVGSTNPDSSIGNPEDLYLNSVSGDLFKKASDNLTWDQQGNLKGPAGSSGASFDPAKNFNTGSGAPDENANLNGLYLDSTNGDLYAVKAAGAPKLLMNLKGPEGGSRVAVAAVGGVGLSPSVSESGQKFLNGVGSPAKETGNLSDVYVDTTNGDLYRKTGAIEWTRFYSVGSKPASSTSGSSNFSSGNGAPTEENLALGAVYLDLQTCSFYHRNADGSIQILFQKNSPILSGKGEASPSLGNLGDLYLDLDAHNLYQKLDANAWTFLMNLNGAKGADGKDGQDGINGKDGLDGKDGKDGQNGVTTTELLETRASEPVVLNLVDTQLGFEHNQSNVSPASFVKLTRTSKVLAVYASSIKEIEIKGQTDRTGTAEYNKKLAQARANTVAGILIKTGLDSRTVSAFGSKMPLKSSCATDNCAEDRWVHISIQLVHSLTLTQRNAIISDLNAEFDKIWK